MKEYIFSDSDFDNYFRNLYYDLLNHTIGTMEYQPIKKSDNIEEDSHIENEEIRWWENGKLN